MTYTVVLSDAAEDDIAEIMAYLLDHAGEKAARNYVDALIDYCQSFATFPERGIRSDSNPRLRLVGYRRRATIVFTVENDRVIIARIFNRGRNVELPEGQL
ncbi:MAG: type II toxin-antitoxin system RelE/ParE family toxin [Neorhizobium sp.]|nr:type II toxin-antitoxin system RelE/ParE family toxin [Neorhizobium sp.]